MSIFIIRGPRRLGARTCTADPLPHEVLSALTHRAIDAGRTVAIRSCSSEQELINALRVADHSRGEIMLLDPGSCTDSTAVQWQLQRMRNAWIEVHDRDDATSLPDMPGTRIANASGYRAQSWVLALDIALEHLGDAEACNPIHVGI